MTLRDCIFTLVRCVGNGGNLLLNTGPRPTGEIIPAHAARYREIGTWLKENGESVYATRGGPYKPGPWGSCTHAKEGTIVYLHILGSIAGNTLALPALPAKVLKARRLDGSPVKVSQKEGLLTIDIPPGKSEPIDLIIALELDRPASDLGLIDTIAQTLTVGAKATSSSQGKEPASVVVASDAHEFSEGTFVKTAWTPAKNDKKPWLQIAFDGPKSVQSVEIRQGKYGRAIDPKQAFVLEARVNGTWKEVYRGKHLYVETGIVLARAVACDALRLQFDSPSASINMINAYGPVGAAK